MRFMYLITCLVISLNLIVQTTLNTAEARQFNNVVKFGAIGDGVHDDTQAFMDAWDATCNRETGSPKMLVPKGYTFLVGPIQFSGPCLKANTGVQVLGSIVAPISPIEWGGPGKHGTWILFKDVRGLTVEGDGIIDGRGWRWWEKSCYNGNHRNMQGCSKAQPHAVNFRGITDGHVKNIRVRNSPMFHITLLGVRNFDVYNIQVDSPEDSPNTDGLHTQDVRFVNISNSQFRSGDDCVSIGKNSSHMYVQNIHCGPGHGISIGSLGANGTEGNVEHIHVRNISFVGTMNGARIKTWQGGSGFCREVTFKHCNFTNVRNPIIIDQHYFSEESPEEKIAVKISNVTFEDLHGTANTTTAITMNCSRVVGCTGLKFKNINLTPTESAIKLKSTCINAKGRVLGSIKPPLTCLQSDESTPFVSD